MKRLLVSCFITLLISVACSSSASKENIQRETTIKEESNEVQTGWVENEGKWMYYDKKGSKQKRTWVEEDGAKYYLDAEGNMLRDTTRVIDGNEYDFDSFGKATLAKPQLYEIFYGVDEFGDEDRNNPGIYNTKYIDGSFSNSATSNSELNALLRYWKNGYAYAGTYKRKDVFDIMLFEYGSYQVKDYDGKYNVTIRFDGQDFSFKAHNWSNRLVFDDIGQQIILNLMLTEQTYRMHIEENTRYGTPSTYLITIDGSGFKKLYDKVNSN